MISLKNITKTYKGASYEVCALKGLSIEVETGEFVSVMGVSGSGKSTLLNIIGLMDRPDSGTYFLDDIDVLELNKKEYEFLRNKRISFVFQNFALINEFTVYENTELPLIPQRIRKSKRKKLVFNILKELGIDDLVNKRPTEISGGQRQRVAIARALISGADIILADEPTGALDSKTGAEVMKLFKKLNEKGKTIILVTHDINVANCADRIINIE